MHRRRERRKFGALQPDEGLEIPRPVFRLKVLVVESERNHESQGEEEPEEG